VCSHHFDSLVVPTDCGFQALEINQPTNLVDIVVVFIVVFIVVFVVLVVVGGVVLVRCCCSHRTMETAHNPNALLIGGSFEFK
jgi:hypothetical protein